MPVSISSAARGAVLAAGEPADLVVWWSDDIPERTVVAGESVSYGFTLSQRVFFKGRTGLGAWIGFALVAGLAAIVTWVLGSIVYMRWLPPSQIYLQAMVTFVAYWPVSKVFLLMRRTLTTAREAL